MLADVAIGSRYTRSRVAAASNCVTRILIKNSYTCSNKCLRCQMRHTAKRTYGAPAQYVRAKRLLHRAQPVSWKLCGFICLRWMKDHYEFAQPCKNNYKYIRNESTQLPAIFFLRCVYSLKYNHWLLQMPLPMWASVGFEYCSFFFHC